MREILFRGKTYDGEWVYGSYYKQTKFYGDEVDDSNIIITSQEDLSFDQALEYFEVQPENIGQYTGLTDKNGEKIFECDIIRCWYHRDGKEDLVTVEQVVFHQGAFVAHATNGTAKWWVHLPNNDGCKPLDKVYLREVEVIGNIHDNSELIGGEEDG